MLPDIRAWDQKGLDRSAARYRQAARLPSGRPDTDQETSDFAAQGSSLA